MKYLVFVALLLISQTAISAINNGFEPESDLMKEEFSNRLLAVPEKSETQPINELENPVLLARKLLKELKLFNLIGEVVQAKHVVNSGVHGLLFEMTNALQATEVVKAWVFPDGKLTKQLQVAKTLDDFFGAPPNGVTFRTT